MLRSTGAFLKKINKIKFVFDIFVTYYFVDDNVDHLSFLFYFILFLQAKHILR